MEIALDGLHNLIGKNIIFGPHISTLTRLLLINIEHGYLRGKKKLSSSVTAASDDPDDRSSGRRTLMDLIIETINKCSEDFDEGVQVQVERLIPLCM